MTRRRVSALPWHSTARCRWGRCCCWRWRRQGLIFGHEAAQGKIVAQIRGVVGDQGGKAIQDMLADTAHKKSDVRLLATVFGLIMLLGQRQRRVRAVAGRDEHHLEGQTEKEPAFSA